MNDAREAGTGFCMIHDTPNSFVMVPRGMVIVASSLYEKAVADDLQGAHDIRWGWMGVKSARQVSTHVKHMLEVYPELQGGPHSEWAACLDKYIIPALAAA